MSIKHSISTNWAFIIGTMISVVVFVFYVWNMWGHQIVLAIAIPEKNNKNLSSFLWNFSLSKVIVREAVRNEMLFLMFSHPKIQQEKIVNTVFTCGAYYLMHAVFFYLILFSSFDFLIIFRMVFSVSHTHSCKNDILNPFFCR